MNKNFSDFCNRIANKTVMVIGLGRSNIPLIKMFVKENIRVIACDSRDSLQLADTIKMIRKFENSENIEFRLGEQYLEKADVDIIFRTPGMNYNSEFLVKARDNGIVVTSEMELFFDLCPCEIIGITGSDGKTTVTTLISLILQDAGYKVHLGGNIGKPLLPNIDNIKKNDIVVVELSSFQLISMRRSPDVAVLTNISPNHLDVHKDMKEYISAKINIFLHQNAFSRSILNYDNSIVRNFKSNIRGKTIFFGLNCHSLKNGVWVDSEKNIKFSQNCGAVDIMNIKEIQIPGRHNIENFLAVIGAVIDKVDIQNIKNIAHTFKGVEHRIEFVREVNGKKFFNDSIASSPNRTISGTLSLCDERIVLIAGGYDKNIPFDELGEYIAKKVKILVLMGNTADKIKSAVEISQEYTENATKIFMAKNMEDAVRLANENSGSGDKIFLSPACASFDLYKDFEERGRHFKQIVNSL